VIFTELRFLAFFVLVLAVHWALRSPGGRKNWLLLCSYVFYGAWDWRFLGLIAASTSIDFVVGLGLGRTPAEARGRRQALVVTSLVANLGLLGFYKYYDFFVESAAELLRWLGFEADLPLLRLVLPVGISFYTFQTLSYTIDVYRGHLAPTRNLRDFALFVSFFPQLVAGPIVRASDFLPQLEQPRRWAQVAVRAELWLFFCGFVKKACLADNVAVLVDQVFRDPAAHTWTERWLGSCLYALQVYGDFSGYSDMALATAGLLGYRLMVNFDFPYTATSMTGLWRRWHISLTSWLRDYVYYPLGGNRRGPLRTYVNLWAIFLICGLWHGAEWNFVLWGVVAGSFLMFERVASERFGFDPEGRGVLRRVYTLCGWMVGLTVFRSPNLAAMGDYLVGLHWYVPREGEPQVAVDPRWWLVVVGFGLLHAVTCRGILDRAVARLPDELFAVLLGAGSALALALAATSHQPFVYFQF
jgi:alginate O-acetyltransferase complex protein AlgI